MASPKFRGCHGGRLFKDAHKVHVAFVAAGLCDRGNLFVRQRKQIFCVFDAAALNILRDAHAEKLLIQMLNIGSAHFHFLRNEIHRPFALRGEANLASKHRKRVVDGAFFLMLRLLDPLGKLE